MFGRKEHGWNDGEDKLFEKPQNIYLLQCAALIGEIA